MTQDVFFEKLDELQLLSDAFWSERRERMLKAMSETVPDVEAEKAASPVKKKKLHK